jgi:hypothetical protein
MPAGWRPPDASVAAIESEFALTKNQVLPGERALAAKTGAAGW